MTDPKEKREIEQSEARDKLAKVLAGMVPLGSSAYELITTIVIPLHEKKKREFLNGLADRLKKLEEEGKIDYHELAESEEFNTIITKAILLAQQNHQEEKLEALRNVVLNASKKVCEETLEFDVVDYFLTIVDRINPIQIILLQTFKNPKGAASQKGIDVSRFERATPLLMGTELKSYFFGIHPELEEMEELVILSWKDLQQFSLVRPISLNSRVSGLEVAKPRITKLGKQFLRMIESEA